MLPQKRSFSLGVNVDGCIPTGVREISLRMKLSTRRRKTAGKRCPVTRAARSNPRVRPPVPSGDGSQHSPCSVCNGQDRPTDITTHASGLAVSELEPFVWTVPGFKQKRRCYFRWKTIYSDFLQTLAFTTTVGSVGFSFVLVFVF